MTVEGQSFFDPLPAGADLYLLKSVLNDWPDEPTVAILRRCAEAARKAQSARPPSPSSAASRPTKRPARWASTCWWRAGRPARSPSSPGLRGRPAWMSSPRARSHPAVSLSSAGPRDRSRVPTARPAPGHRHRPGRQLHRPGRPRGGTLTRAPEDSAPGRTNMVSALPIKWLQCNPVIKKVNGLGDAMEASSPLDAYSQIVSGVAERLTPKVASLRVPRSQGRWESLGSGVVFTGDGFLLTNAHVVGKSTSGTASFSDGTSAPFRVVGADPLSDLAVLRANGPTPEPAELGEADKLVVGSWWSRSATRWASRIGDRRAWSARWPLPAARGRLIEDVSVRRALNPGNSGGALADAQRPGDRHQHRRGGHGPGHGGPGQRHHPADHLRADARRPGPAGLPGPGHDARPGAGPTGGAAGRRPTCSSPRWSAARRWAGLRPGTCC